MWNLGLRVSRGERGQQYECSGRDEKLQRQRSQMRLNNHLGLHLDTKARPGSAEMPDIPGNPTLIHPIRI